MKTNSLISMAGVVLLVLSGHASAGLRADRVVLSAQDDNLNAPTGTCSEPCLYSTMSGAHTSGAPSQEFTNTGFEAQWYLADFFPTPAAGAFRGWIIESVDVLGYYTQSSDVPPGSTHTGVNLYLIADSAGGPAEGGATVYPPDNAFVDRNGATAMFEGMTIVDTDDGDYLFDLTNGGAVDGIFLEPGST